MAVPTLLQTKFLIPRRSAQTIRRPHLLARLQGNLDKRLILLSTPPGYGKTTLLASFATATALPHTWYQLDNADNDPVVFLTAFIESVRLLSPDAMPQAAGFGGTARALLEASGQAGGASPDQALTVLLNEMMDCLGDPWLLVLEDYQVITNPDVHRLVDRLLDAAPPGMTVLLSTRSDPPLATARLRARGLMADLRASDLRLAEDEVQLWLGERLPDLSPGSIRLLSERTEGWAAGLQLALSSLAGRDPAQSGQIVQRLHGAQHVLFDYLVSEVFAQQPADVQQFLMHSAVLEHMNAAVCNALPGIDDGQAMLNYLSRQNLFVSRLDDHHEWYRYHHLFREFLLGKLRRDHPDRFAELHRTAGRYYETEGQQEVAVEHFLQAGDWQAAAAVLQTLAPQFTERGRVVVLRRMLAALPESVLADFPALLIHYGDVLRRGGQPAEAILRYEKARRAFESRGDDLLLAQSLIGLGELARVQGDYPRAETLVADALGRIPPDDHARRAQALIALAKSRGFLSGMDEGRRLAEEALAEARLAGDSLSHHSRAHLLQSLGQICWWHGDPPSTVRYCSEALQTLPDELSPIAARACISLATPSLYWGRLDEALAYAERGLEIAQRLEFKEIVPSAYTALGNVLTRSGDTARAESCLRQAVEMAASLGLATYERVMATGYLAYNLYGQGRIDEAQQLAEGALWSYAGNPDTYEVYVCRSVLADIALERGQLAEAERLFTQLLEVGERRQFRIPLGMVYFGLAYISLAGGRQAEGEQLGRRSLALIEPTNAVQLYQDQGERARVVCGALQQAGVRSSFIDRIMQQWPAPASFQRNSAQAAAVVSVRSLGQLVVSVDGEDISPDQWNSAKARDLLALFVTHRRERLHIERVLEAMWPESAAQGKRAFHTALYRLRGVLRASGRESKFILVEAGEYWLDSARFQVDVDEFDAALARARAVESLDSDAAVDAYQQAVALYGGDYLSNLYYDWVFPEQRRLQADALAALQRIGEYHQLRGGHERALEAFGRSLRIDPLQEQVHCLVMRSQHALGNSAAVASQYKALRDLLAEELGIGPHAATTSLYQRLVETN